MPSQQFIAPPAGATVFLVATVRDGAEVAIKEFLPALSGLGRTVSFRSAPEEQLVPVTGIGADLWDRLWGKDTRPAHLHRFEEIVGAKHTAVSTPGDLLFHIRGRRLDTCFELAKLIAQRLDGIADIIDEVHGFKFYDNRDLLGFVDGTENPEGDAAVKAVLIGDEDPAYTGGSYVIIQKYLHDIPAWEVLSVEEQEHAIGRSKVDDVEMPDALKPANAHIKLNVIEDADGNQLQIMRDNMPFGEVSKGEYGTFFIGYAKDPAVTEQMLHNMFIGDPVGTYDRILDFSTAKTGCLFFTPSIEFLDNPQPARH